MARSERAVKTQSSIFDTNSKIAKHVYQHNHNMDFDNVEIIDRANNYHKILFLETYTRM